MFRRLKNNFAFLTIVIVIQFACGQKVNKELKGSADSKLYVNEKTIASDN